MSSDSEGASKKRRVGRPRRIDYSKIQDAWKSSGQWNWETGTSQINKAELARSYGISERHLRRILAKPSSC
jgi:hypothetical protein